MFWNGPAGRHRRTHAALRFRTIMDDPLCRPSQAHALGIAYGGRTRVRALGIAIVGRLGDEPEASHSIRRGGDHTMTTPYGRI